MWNLILNLQYPDLRPLLESDHDPSGDEDENGNNSWRYLINDRPYSNAALDRYLLAGGTPDESALRYSDELKTLVKRCLCYDCYDRPDLKNLRDEIDRHIRDPPATKAGGPLRMVIPGGIEALREGQTYT